MVNKTCKERGCTKPVWARGMCNTHYAVWRRRNPEEMRRWTPPMSPGDAEAYYWANSRKLRNGCREWLGSRSGPGYGHFQGMYVHQWVYEYFVGPIPEGMEVDHNCHNQDISCSGGECPHRLCVERGHLDVVPHMENVKRGRAGGKFGLREFCPQGHKMTDENRYVRPDGLGSMCRTCQQEREKTRGPRTYNPERRHQAYLRKKARDAMRSLE